MNVVLWIVQVLLAFAFLGSGILKVTKAKEELEPTMPWVEDFSGRTIRLIGGLEVVGALGLLLPSATGIGPVLSPVAAVGLGILMALAAATHVRRKEVPFTVVPLTLLAMAAFVAWGRFGPYPL